MGGCCGRKTTRSQPEFKYHASLKKNPKQLKKRTHDDPNILIVGAGAAGLACAVSLLNEDFHHVRIAEASNRIGGRILTTSFGGFSVDLGAQWVHGQEQNVIYEEVYNKDMLDTSSDQYRNIEWIRSTGQRVPQESTDMLMKIMANIFEKRHGDLYLYSGSFNSYLSEKFKEELSREPFKRLDKMLALEFLNSFKKMEGTSSGCNDEMGCLGFDKFIECPGDSMLNWKDSGFSKYLNFLIGANETNKLGQLKDIIDFNCKVIKVEWDNYDGSVSVACANGKNYLVDHVIVTVPLGVLRRNLTFFRPQLPADKRRAINYTGFGHACKIYLNFSKPFWPTDWCGFVAMWTDSDFGEMVKSKQEWMCDIIGFYTVNHRPNLLQAWAIGCSVELIETLSLDELTRGTTFILNKFLPNWPVSIPIDAITSKFTVDDNFLGAYSYSSVLTQRYFTGPEELLQPINVMAILPEDNSSVMTLTPMTVRPVILFAGEATSPDHFSTVHGAIETGRREASRLIGYYCKNL